ncbi:hypothetical protein K491DRAFT_679867 [Lophiostoma macrostomum CBS 122681]|uniref:Major facilitator superfamily (MFS) profile domain-containing protein n=1 Tax=Lophiostoma macrostomum CBS 122681 TaxID=1314788 RepID=A0A6A6T2P0_9PLEO|nr:hypothetical protein K491DRAFT_679867 [Lophiostoma macrostomum CBS 122681]
MSYYFPTVLISYVGVSAEMARLLTARNSVSYLIVSGIAIPLVERVGRRGLMLASTAGQGLCFFIITVLLRYANHDTSGGQVIASASIAFFFLYYIAFGIGMLGVPWLYPTEINSLP